MGRPRPPVYLTPFPPLDASPFRVGFLTGATPDKWAGIWRQRTPRDPLELVPVEQPEERPGSLRRPGHGLVRLPICRDGLHCIPLYDEVPVAVMGAEHVLTLLDEVSSRTLADEQLVLPTESGPTPSAEQLAWP